MCNQIQMKFDLHESRVIKADLWTIKFTRRKQMEKNIEKNRKGNQEGKDKKNKNW